MSYVQNWLVCPTFDNIEPAESAKTWPQLSISKDNGENIAGSVFLLCNRWASRTVYLDHLQLTYGSYE